MIVTQEPKYTTNAEGQLVNRTTGIPIPDDEPVFILRAKDRKAAAALRMYAAACDDPDHRAVARSRALDFDAFARQFPERMKEPDCSLQDLAAANVGRAPYEAPKAAPAVQRVPAWPFPDGSAT